MCGIVGCTGIDDTRSFLLGGLKMLEYRGYDSAGIAMITSKGLVSSKAIGHVKELEAAAHRLPQRGSASIAHTRWATHGGVTEANAHPQFDTLRKIAVVHNGIVENHTALRTLLESEGTVFISETDTEVIAHLIAKLYSGDLCEAVRLAVREIRGTFGIAVIHADEPDVIIVARMGSPLVIGVGKGFHIVASDVTAVMGRTQNVVYLNDGEVAKLTPDEYQVFSLEKTPINPMVHSIDQKLESIERGSFAHYMLKEIFDQPRSLENTMRGRLKPETGDVVLGGPALSVEQILEIERILFVACGTALHAAMIGEYLIEELAHLPVDAEYASEFRYRNPIIEEQHGGRGGEPVRRNGGHAGGAARGEGTRGAGAGRRERGGFVDRPRDRSGCLHCAWASRSAWQAPRRSPGRSRSIDALHAVPRPVRDISADQCSGVDRELEQVPAKMEDILEHDARIRSR
jgi:glucosamine--fructose-6-phosphate aminotransferase (isomerizing)